MTEAELNSALAKMLSSLGDRYTRYLPPAKYATIVQVPTLTRGKAQGCECWLSLASQRVLHPRCLKVIKSLGLRAGIQLIFVILG